MMMIESATKREVVGRLFNRSPIPQLGTKFEDPYHEQTWLTQTEPPIIGGGFFPWDEEALRRSPKSVTDIKKSKNLKQSRLDDSLKQEQRCRLNEEVEDRERIQCEFDTSDFDTGDEERLPLMIEDEAIEILPHRKTHPQYKTQTSTSTSKTLPSALAKGKRPRRQRNTVAFAGDHVLVEKSDQMDTVLRCEFLDMVEVSYIPLFSDYSQQVFHTLWYTQQDIDRMKHDHFYWKKLSRQSRRSQSPLAAHSTSVVSKRLTRAGRRHNLRFLRHQRTMTIVLKEQERQRQMCHRIYGRILDRSGNRCSNWILEPDRLRDVYIRAGKTTQKHEEAVIRAKSRQLDSSPYSYERFETDSCASPTINTTTNVTTNARNGYSSEAHCQQEPTQNEPTTEEWSSMAASYSDFCLGLSTSFGDGIHCVFFTLLTPFLKQQDGPLFLEIGEELTVAA